MSIYARLYIDGSEQSPDLEIADPNVFTGLNTVQTKVGVGAGVGTRTIDINQNWYHADSGLVYPNTALSKDVLNEPWDDLTDWTETNAGDGDSEIDPAGQLHQSASTRPSSSQLDQTLSDIGTDYTIEIRSVVNTMEGFTSYFCNWNLADFGDFRLEWGWETDIESDSYARLYTSEGSQLYYHGITVLHTFRVLLSTSEIPPTPSDMRGASGGWFIF